MPQGSDEIMFIALILGIAIFILVALLVATFAIIRSGTLKRKEFSSTSSAETLSAPIPKDGLKEESIFPSPPSEIVIPVPQDGHKNTFKVNQQAINLLGVPITLALMIGLILILLIVNPIVKFFADAALGRWFWSILVISIGIGGGGAMGVRIACLSWRQTVLTALLVGAAATLVSRSEISPFQSGPWAVSDINFQFYPFLLGTLAVSAPVFLLPLFDPLVRQSGLAPSRVKVVLAALVISALFVLTLPIAVMVFVGFTGFLLGIGLFLSLYRPMKTAGAELGGLGLLLLPSSSFAWLAYVSGSFS